MRRFLILISAIAFDVTCLWSSPTLCPRIYILDEQMVVKIPTDTLGFQKAILALGYKPSVDVAEYRKYVKTSSALTTEQVVIVYFSGQSVVTFRQSVLSLNSSVLAAFKQAKDSLASDYGSGSFSQPNENELLYRWSARCGMPNEMDAVLSIEQKHNGSNAYLTKLEYCASTCDITNSDDDYLAAFRNSLDLGFSLSLASSRASTTIGGAGVIARVSYVWAEYTSFLQPSKDVFPMGELSMSGISFGISIPITKNTSIDLGAAYYTGEYSIYSNQQVYTGSGTDWQPCGGLRLGLGEQGSATIHYDADRGLSVGFGIRGGL